MKKGLNTAKQQNKNAVIQRKTDELEKRTAGLTAEPTQSNGKLAHETAVRLPVEEPSTAFNNALEQHVAEHERELSALYELSLIAHRAESLESLLDEALDRAMSALNSHTGILLLFEEEADLAGPVTGRVLAQRSKLPEMPHVRDAWLAGNALFAELLQRSEPLLIPDISQDERLPEGMRRLGPQILLLTPLWIEGQTRGLVGLMRPAGFEPDAQAITLLRFVAAQIGAAVQGLELRQLEQEVGILAERERLGRDLHDSVTQSLYGLTTLAEAGQAQLESGDLRRANRSLERIAQTARQALKEMRLFIHELRPNLLEQEGLVGALQLRLASVEGRADTQTRMLADESLQLPQEVENALYRIALEALNNTMRHSGASSVTVSLRRDGNEVILEVADDGRGFDPEQNADGRMGLNNIHSYASEVDGRLQISSAPGRGTTVTVTIEVRP